MGKKTKEHRAKVKKKKKRSKKDKDDWKIGHTFKMDGEKYTVIG